MIDSTVYFDIIFIYYKLVITCLLEVKGRPLPNAWRRNKYCINGNGSNAGVVANVYRPWQT